MQVTDLELSKRNVTSLCKVTYINGETIILQRDICCIKGMFVKFTHNPVREPVKSCFVDPATSSIFINIEHYLPTDQTRILTLLFAQQHDLQYPDIKVGN